jgi:hypothetical protein
LLGNLSGLSLSMFIHYRILVFDTFQVYGVKVLGYKFPA